MPLRTIFFNPWAGAPEDTAAYLAALPARDIAPHLPPGADARLRDMARLDRDWYGECARCFAALEHPAHEFASALTVGPSGLAELADLVRRKPADERWWMIFIAHHPQKLGPALAPFCAFLRKNGVRIAYYAFDEASREMPCFAALAPHLDVLVHDEFPLGPAASGLRADCVVSHRSWVANIVPGSVPLDPAPDGKIVFLGSQLGLTSHRRRQIEHLARIFGDRFVASHDHSLPVARRGELARHSVGFCPEGRKFSTPAMARTHTDRPFWSGCMGLVPVSENSAPGGRLDALAEAGLIERYPHGDLDALVAACKRALAAPLETRRRIHEHFNRHETVGPVIVEHIARFESAA